MRATYAATADNGAESLIRPTGSGAELHGTQGAEVPVTAVTVGESPRSTGADEEHIARLAETEEQLPPILVDRRTMRVIDGVHRLAAARLRGQQTIAVKFFDGCADDAFLRGVEANVTHGLPLSQADRRAAAARIVATHPHLSDRSIARASGLGAKTVAALRRSSGAGTQDNLRVGGDGRVRPLSSVEGRQRAAEILAEQPQASLREVARMAGISPTTVSDVRKLLEAGRDPRTPGGGHRARAEVNSCLEQGRSSTSITAPITAVADPAGRRVQPHRVDPAAVLQKLVRDPALRQRESGRHLLRLLQHNAVDQHMWADLATAVPAHAGGLVADLARQYAQTWAALAQELYERSEDLESQRMTG
ncbi:ParB N-terminal domain-containing protein [Streptomyces sp. NBC_00347]|uniref:ParB and winged helix-turn-helix domain-containing protein n=1 Tax=Streptomyces sp. NBC_00347 TaxID=2975721 RepID=UPI00225BFC6A|nr:ParB N-terminal domain-containing protein [Streptomyces sp. NBC_00347]MCX5122883.1 ParB N-terminal domain-containing protein [Streptomyces sp. NBC_00347]